MTELEFSVPGVHECLCVKHGNGFASNTGIVVFESMAVRDLRVYADGLGGETLINEGAVTLNALSGIIDTSRQEPVAFKMVLTATGEVAYRRPEDGVIVCPLSALRP